MIIDADVHVGAAYGAGASSPENLVRMADRLGFDKMIASHLLSLHYDMEEGDRELAGIVKRCSGRILGYAAVPTAWPITPHVAITRVLPNATWVALMFRPANKRLPMFREYSERSGML